MAFCTKCGRQFAFGASFCGGCGTAVVTTISPETTAVPVTISPETTAVPALNQAPRVSGDENVKLFVRENVGYFLKKWAIAEQNKNKESWNWAACFLGAAWFAYRKMYLYSWGLMGVEVVATLFEYAFNVSAKVSIFINLGIPLICGWHSNYAYKLHVEKKVKEITAIYAPEQAKIELTRQGGTNIGAAIGSFVLLGMIILIIVAVAELSV